MKTSSLAIGLTAAAFALVLLFTPRLYAKDKGCKIMVQFKRVVIPVTKLTPADAKALDQILNAYGPSLYQIVIFDHGVPGRPHGFLENRYICEKAAIVNAARENGDSGEGIQVGGKGCTPACQQHLHNDDVVAQVEKILQKYCQ